VIGLSVRPRLLILATLPFWPSLALADNLLSGEDAAYIDWGVNNCSVKSTDKEHTMVDQANAKNAAGFLRKYQTKDLSGALSTPAKQAALCADIKAWYGPYGSRFADLIRWESAPTSTASDKPAGASSPSKGRKRSSQ
jgi:hypothetical protein